MDLDPVDADNPETNGSREPTVLSNRLKSIVETDQHPDKNTIVIDSISDSVSLLFCYSSLVLFVKKPPVTNISFQTFVNYVVCKMLLCGEVIKDKFVDR